MPNINYQLILLSKNKDRVFIFCLSEFHQYVEISIHGAKMIKDQGVAQYYDHIEEFLYSILEANDLWTTLRKQGYQRIGCVDIMDNEDNRRFILQKIVKEE